MQAFIAAAVIAIFLFMIVGIISVWTNESVRATIREAATHSGIIYHPPTLSNSLMNTGPAEVVLTLPRPVVMDMRDRNNNTRSSYVFSIPLHRRALLDSLGKRNAPINWRRYFRLPR